MARGGRRPEIRTIILTGAEGNFSSGMDLRSLAGDADEEDALPEDVLTASLANDADFIYRGLLKTYQPPKPVIAAVEGNAIAGGTEILQGTDIRVAGEGGHVRRLRGQVVAVPDGRLGRPPAAPDPVHHRRRDPAHRQAPHRPGGRRHRPGRPRRPRPAKPWTKAREIAEVINYNGPLAVEAILRRCGRPSRCRRRRPSTTSRPTGMAVMGSEDAKEGPKAFKEKRTPELPAEVTEVRTACRARTSRSPTPCTSRGFYATNPFPHWRACGRRHPWPGTTTLGYWALSRLRRGATRSPPSPHRFCSGKGILTLEIGVEYPTPADDDAHRPAGAHGVPQAGRSPAFQPVADRSPGAGGRDRVLDLLEPDPRPASRSTSCSGVRPVPAPHHRRPAGPARRRLGGLLLLVRGHDPGALDLSPEERDGGPGSDMRAYFFEVIAEKRAEPRRGPHLRAHRVRSPTSSSPTTSCYMFLNQLLVAGNETTRNTHLRRALGAGRAPRPVAAAGRRPRRSSPPAVEEILRWTTPVIAFMRTATGTRRSAAGTSRGGDPC